MTDFHLRPARSTDAGKVGAILSAFIDDTPWMPRIHTRAEDVAFAGMMIDKGFVTIAANDTVVGFSAREGEMVHALYVAEDARNQGCGAQLMAQMKAESPALKLWTFQANEGAQRFYLAHGFTEAERTDGAENDENLPDIRYVWRQEA